MPDPRLSGLPASVPPYAALWLLRQIPEMERAVDWWGRQGRRDIAADLRVAIRQLRLSADQVKTNDGVPRIGSAEVAGSRMGAGSDAVVDPPGTMTVAEAAEELHRSNRQVINLIGSKVLIAVQRGRGCSWEIDRQSVLDLKTDRRLK